MPEADYWTKMDVSEVEVESGKVKPLAATTAAESNPIYSRDGKYVAFSKSSEPVRWASDSRIVLLTRQSGQTRVLPPTEEEQPQIMGWSADSTRLLFAEPKRTKIAIYEMPVDGPARVLFTPAKGTVNGMNLNARGTHLGFAMERTDEPVEAYAMAIGAKEPVRVSRSNVDLAKPPVGETQVIRWKAKDGREIEGLLTLPVGYEKGKKYPLLLNIHGGPTGVFGETYLGRGGIYPMAAFASKGWAILRCNIRGSSGYGKEFRFANMGDWGGKDYGDLMAGVDHVISMGVADPEHMAVTGWSYGGFMTSWVITQTKRFKAAVVGAGVTNLWSFTGTADIPGFLPDYFAGEPWDNFDAYQKHSPMSFVKNVSTPTLVLHGESDLRVPISQGYELYNAIKRQNVTAKMVVYPRMPHGPTEPKFMLDIMNRHLDWLEKYAK
jgi:dipeptidyl aminopeptidase/acylaminoacyl peptidase